MIRKNSCRAWALAARPKTLTAAFLPIFVAGGLAWHDHCFLFVPVLLCLAFAGGMQIAANFINDWLDCRKGSDRADRLGPERACAQGWISSKAMRVGIVVSLVLSCLAGLAVIPYGGWGLVWVGIVCIAFAFLYTSYMSYWGLGDVLVFVFFGFVPVMGTYSVQGGDCFSPPVLVGSLACGAVINTLLMVNNYRDRAQDVLSGKRTLVVRLGEPFGRWSYLVLGVFAALCALWVSHSLVLLYLLPHVATWRKLSQWRSGKQLNRLLGETSRNMLLFGLLFVMGLLLSA